MRTRARAVVWGAFLLAAASWAPPARADAPSDADLAAARRLFHDAEADERAGKWIDALAKLRRAATVKLTPGLRFHIAVCEREEGHLAAALDDFIAAQDAARAENNREVMALVSEPLLALKVRVPTLAVELPPEFSGPGSNVEVRLDGTLLSNVSLGTPLPVEVGSHTIQAVAPGQVPYSATVTVVERQAESVRVKFVPLGTPASQVATAAAPAAPPPSSRRDLRPYAIATSIGAVVLGVAGIGAYAAAGSDQSYWINACRGMGAGCGNATPVRAWDATALTAWILAGASAAVSVVLWTRPSSTGGAQGELRFGPGSVGVAGRF